MQQLAGRGPRCNEGVTVMNSSCTSGYWIRHSTLAGILNVCKAPVCNWNDCLVQKLVLEVMMLRSLTTRDVFSLMHVTLAAYETRPGHGASAPDDAIAAEPQQSGNDQQMQSLYHCGLAALRALNREALVNNFDEGAPPAHC